MICGDLKLDLQRKGIKGMQGSKVAADMRQEKDWSGDVGRQAEAFREETWGILE